MAALLWVIAGTVLIIAEVLSGEFVLVMLGLAALAAAASAGLGLPLWVDVVVFTVVSLGLVTLARPALKRRMRVGDEVRMHTDALIGGKATVVATTDSQDGRVRIAGEVWSARSFDETQVLEEGQEVVVLDIRGATAVVWREPWELPS
ncbi:NfeD family protein [Actinoalloteichus sp. AHMU CJ021]|uniref:Membrane protein implicated in regulation of membrane protease activity n=1 Tax=Actinoalloteichus caeruleus DSM 43889 TaxID=1120930 RepID=A0ABT1JBU4_ACTCY|nr:NfeD family protein [Actinoalloteichus caeruleus]AUS80589.1 NfeD family protein [Actinoalloteichus sp. AHMU CJ021]MCP2329967.1 Membrane protein implicated in regulation of membrane protease activity [Actinoalloteichus caeruleus DSM 43889]